MSVRACWITMGLFGLTSATSAQTSLLQQATATFSQTAFGDFSARLMVDGDVSPNANGWAIFDAGINGTTEQIAAVEFGSNFNSPVLRLQIIHAYSNPGHLLGRFRISVTADDRRTFCDGLQSGGDVSATWFVTPPARVSVPDGTTWTLLPDDSILIGGANFSTGTYTGEFSMPFAGVTGLRLEVMEHASLPANGPGRYAFNGNFVVTELLAAEPCYADCDVSTRLGVLDIFDFLCFQNEFAASAAYACECDTSTGRGVCDIFDFLCFQNAFAAGCP